MCTDPLLMMSESDVETFHTPLKPSNLRKRTLNKSPQSISQPEPTVKKSRRARTLSVGANSQHISVMSLEALHVSNKLDKLVNLMELVQGKLEKVDALEASVAELKEKILTIAPPVNSEEVLMEIKSEIKDLKSTLGNIPTPQEMIVSTQEALTRLNNSNLNSSEAVMDISGPVKKIPLTAVIPNVEEEFLKPRSRDFFKSLHNGDRLDIHNRWLQSDPPFIPPNYLPKKMPYIESEREYQIRRVQKLNELDAYMELLKVKQDIGKNSCESIDAEVKRKIDESDFDPEEKSSMILQYETKIKEDEEVSKKKWQNGKKGVEELKERSKDKILVENHRTYKVVLKSNKKKNSGNDGKTVNGGEAKSNTAVSKLVQKTMTPARKGKGKEKTKAKTNNNFPQYPNIPMNFSVPPPQYPFPWAYPPMPQR